MHMRNNLRYRSPPLVPPLSKQPGERRRKEGGVDEGGCCWQSKSDLMPAECAGMGATVKQRWSSCEHAHTHTPSWALLQGLVIQWWVKYIFLTHTYKHIEKKSCVLMNFPVRCHMSHKWHFRYLSLKGEGYKIKGIKDKGGRNSMKETDGQRERGLMGLF